MKRRWLLFTLAFAFPAAAHAADAPTDTLKRVVPVEGVEVSTTRTDASAPIARTVVKREQLERVNSGQDTPMALATLPGAYAYSDAGNGIGYSYLSIRGFSQRRISVLINGVPLNDPESHEVYWIDHPDLLASTREAEVQRGVGSALYGAASVGGSVNLETSPFTDAPASAASVSYGSYATRRVMVEMNSGRLAHDWNFYGRYSRVDTDGYREQSWTHVWSYYLSARRVFGDQMVRLNLFGGPETTHLAYVGLPQSALDGGLTGNADADRRHNPLTYPYEADHFFEPHYELMHSWSPRAGLALTQTLFWFDGTGYYDEQRLGEALASYRLDTLFTADSTRLPRTYYLQNPDGSLVQVGGEYRGIASDIVRRRTITNQHYGWVPRLRLEHRNGALTLGGELRAHDGHHVGEVLSGTGLPPGTPSVSRYYDYHPRTLSGGLFAREEWRPVTALTVTGDLAWRHQDYAMRDDRFDGYRFDQSYDFALPRVGASWQPREALRVFGSWAYSEREPRFSDLYNGETVGNTPLFAHHDPTTGTYSDPLVRPEQVNDWELGGSLGDRALSLTANLFRMDFRDELVDYQFNSDLATWVTANAAQSVHQGVELALAGESKPRHDLTLALDANATLSDNHYVRFDEAVDAGYTVNRDGKAIPFFPAVLANVGVRGGWRGVSLGADVQHAGRMYLDNSEDVDGSIAPHAVLNLTGGVRMHVGGASALLDLRLLNALDRRYETGGYFDYDESGHYAALKIPAARRNALGELRVEF
ncbi:MAG TPA: TonB-dependent receptor [Dongiaceae bacterium]|nr:TonB-dependent receptor [Dongiaceae bacterium]